MKTRAQKSAEVSELTEEIGKASNAFLIDFKGITVPQVTELRKQVRETKSGYVVVKNTLARKATQGTPAENVAKAFDGSTSIAYNANDPVSLAKALTAYAKTNPLFVFKAGIVEGRVINLADIANIAAMPSKQDLIAKLLFLIKYRINHNDPHDCIVDAHRDARGRLLARRLR